VQAQQEKAQRDSRAKRARVEEGLRLKHEVQDASKVYDWMGAPFEPPASKRREYVSVQQHELVPGLGVVYAFSSAVLGAL
jgi:hypothetical protein